VVRHRRRHAGRRQQLEAPFVDARRTSQNTNDLRGKINRIKVNADGSYSIPASNLFGVGTPKTRPEIYAMGFRNPYRIQVDSNDVAYITDYSPDSNVPENFRGPAGTGRVEIVTKPSNYGWPLCYAPNLPYYRWLRTGTYSKALTFTLSTTQP
jgi:cytochrome c